MPDLEDLNRPWLVAVWPGMGRVALAAGYYLLARLGMHGLAELSARELFEMEHVEVKQGLIRTGRLPRSRLFRWRDEKQERDIVVFIGEAQPPIGKYAFCKRLIQFAEKIEVERVFTFAAMATDMHPEHRSRVFGAAIDEASLEELRRHNLEILQDGQIGGLNGVLLGVAQEHGLRGACLLGEMPQVFAQLPYLKASLAVLKAFTGIAEIELNFDELAQQADAMDAQLGEFLAQVKEKLEGLALTRDEDEGFNAEPADEGRIAPADEQRIERLFDEAEKDRTKAYELKAELDRLDVFQDYEDRFLDLFKSPEQ